jgi:hypothetical protein
MAKGCIFKGKKNRVISQVNECISSGSVLILGVFTEVENAQHILWRIFTLGSIRKSLLYIKTLV